MRHRHMQALADGFERHGIATLRFDFPFIAAGRSRVDSPQISQAAIAAAFAAARTRTDLPLWAGGHSFGARMTSHAVGRGAIAPVGSIFCSFPLHKPGQPEITRAAHLSALALPMLFLSGTRDALAERDLLEPLVASLPSAELHWLDTANHGYGILKRTRATAEDVYDEAARVARAFIERRR